MVLFLVLLHAADGSEIEINPHEVVTIRHVPEESTQVHDQVNCLITMTNGKAIGVIETCKEVVRIVGDALK
jgi:uncharacterized protein YlzI (FlbEa/FlbD family)